MKLGIKMPNGEQVEARSEVWLAAIVVSLPPQIRDSVIDYVTKPGSAHMMLAAVVAKLPEWQKQRIFALVADRGVTYKTPGSYILEAEGTQLSLFQR